MKDIVITRKRMVIEGKVFLACLVAAELFNLYAIIELSGKWSELFWSLGFVVVTAVVVYLVLGVLRLLFCFLKRLSKRNK